MNRPARHQLWIALAMAALTVLVYGRAIGFDFVHYDDQVYVAENRMLHQGWTPATIRWLWTTDTGGNWHPLTWLSLLLDQALYGNSPGGYHATNILLHALATVLLFLALTKLSGAPWRSAMVAALFALHPLHVESVAWISERKDTLSGCFWMLTLLAYAHYVAVRSGGRVKLTVGQLPLLWRTVAGRRYLLVIAAFAAGLMAKSMLVTLPCVLLLLDVWPLRRLPLGSSAGRQAPVSWQQAMAEKVPLFALAVAVAVVTMFTQRQVGAMGATELFPLGQRLANALWSYAAYLGKMVVPIRLQVFYPHPQDTLAAWQLLLAAAVLTAISVLAVRLWSRAPYVAIGWCWYLATLVPVVGLVQVGMQGMADRYTYLPLIGPFIAIVWGTTRFLRPTSPARRRLLAATALAALTALAATTWVQLGHWRNTMTLFSHAVRVNPNNALAHTQVGWALATEATQTTDPARRDALYDRALGHYQQALALNPGNGEPLAAMASIAFKRGQKEEALSLYAEAVRRQPKDADARFNYGVALADTGRHAEAVDHYKAALGPRSEDPVLLASLAASLEAIGQPEAASSLRLRAADLFQADLRFRADDVDFRFALASNLCEAGRVNDALPHLRALLRQRPDHAEALNLQGILHKRQGDWPAAIAAYRQAIAANPRLGLAWHNLGVALEHTQQPNEARNAYARALAVGYGSAQLHFNLGNLYHRAGELDAAVEHYRQAIALDANYPNPYTNLGAILSGRQQLADALPLYRRATELLPQDASALCNYGIVLLQAGDSVAAILQARRALAIDPGFAKARDLLEAASQAAAAPPHGPPKQ